jgi:hypothetical protein
MNDWYTRWSIKKEEEEPQIFKIDQTDHPIRAYPPASGGRITNTMDNFARPTHIQTKMMADELYKDAMSYIVCITLNTDLSRQEQMEQVGEVVANLFNAIIELDATYGEKELAKYFK